MTAVHPLPPPPDKRPPELDHQIQLLGALLNQPSLTATIGIEPEHWANPMHGAIHEAIAATWAEHGDDTTLLHIVHTIADRPDGKRILAAYRAGGDLVTYSKRTTGDPRWHAKYVRRAAQLRAIKAIAIGLDQASDNTDLDDDDSVDDLLEHAIKVIVDTFDDPADTKPAANPRLVSGAQFILGAPREAPSVWGRHPEVLWAQGEPLLLAGPPGVGKTTLSGQILRARLGLQDSVLGWPVTPTASKVLYLAMDRPPQIGRSMARLFHQDDFDVLEERLVVWKGPPDADMARHPDSLARLCAEVGADTVFIDSLKDAAIKLTDDEVGAGINSAMQRALADGVEVMALHHQVKRGNNGAVPDTLADVYGSAWITAGAGSVILLWGESGDPVVQLHHRKQPAEEIGPLRLVHDHTTGTTEVFQEADLMALVSGTGHHGLTVQAAAVTMFETAEPTPAQIQKARRKLDRLVADGNLHRRDGAVGGAKGGEPARYFLASIRGARW